MHRKLPATKHFRPSLLALAVMALASAAYLPNTHWPAFPQSNAVVPSKPTNLIATVSNTDDDYPEVDVYFP